MGTIEDMPVGSVLVGRADGACMIEILALLKKSALPPKPFNILRNASATDVIIDETYLEPATKVELA